MPKVTKHGGATPAPIITYPKGKAKAARKAEPPADNPYADWIGDELRAELADRELPTKGRNAELVQRLVESDAAAAADDGDDDQVDDEIEDEADPA